VYRILKAATLDTDAWEWIKKFNDQQNGRLAFKALREHYDGPGTVDTRIALARQQLLELHYKSEQSFPFESYVTKMTGAFQVLAECKEGMTEKYKVQAMLEGMKQCTNQAIVPATTTIAMTPALQTDFVAAANKMPERSDSQGVFPPFKSIVDSAESQVCMPKDAAEEEVVDEGVDMTVDGDAAEDEAVAEAEVRMTLGSCQVKSGGRCHSKNGTKATPPEHPPTPPIANAGDAFGRDSYGTDGQQNRRNQRARQE
jgi:hypothetical protein